MVFCLAYLNLVKSRDFTSESQLKADNVSSPRSEFIFHNSCHSEFIYYVINEWLNDNICKGKIKFKMDCDPSTIPFSDVRVNFINGFLLTETYSKETDIHQYPNPSSCHPPHMFRSILGIRIRRNCSDRYENVSKFIENLREFKGHLVTSGYDSKLVDKEFGKLAILSRKKVLNKQGNSKKKEKRDNVRKYRFLMAYEPAFPDIKKVLLSHQNIIYEDEELREVFPNGARDFQVSERREAKNIKELLATSTIFIIMNEEENSGNQTL